MTWAGYAGLLRLSGLPYAAVRNCVRRRGGRGELLPARISARFFFPVMGNGDVISLSESLSGRILPDNYFGFGRKSIAFYYGVLRNRNFF